MADYDIFREQLAIKYPSYGHALWRPCPKNPDRPVEIGDVGFIRRGKFHRLFNALLPADDPSHELGVPEYHEPLVPSLLDHFDADSLDRNNYCSAGVSVKPDPGHNGRYLLAICVLKPPSLTSSQPRRLSAGLVSVWQDTRSRSIIPASNSSARRHSCKG